MIFFIAVACQPELYVRTVSRGRDHVFSSVLCMYPWALDLPASRIQVAYFCISKNFISILHIESNLGLEMVSEGQDGVPVCVRAKTTAA